MAPGAITPIGLDCGISLPIVAGLASVVRAPLPGRTSERMHGTSDDDEYTEAVVYTIRKAAMAARIVPQGRRSFANRGRPAATLSQQITASVVVTALDPKVPSIVVRTDQGRTINVRIIEIPTTWWRPKPEAVRCETPARHAPTIADRADTSPIWYTPNCSAPRGAIPEYDSLHARAGTALRNGMKTVVAWMVAATALAGAAATPVTAQPVSDEWQIVVAPYLMGAAMDGTTTLRGREADVNVSASDIFSNLQFGAMGLLEAKKGNWGFGADVIWMALGSTVRETNVDFNQGAFAFYGIRRLGAAADLTFGARVNTLQGELDFKSIGVQVSQDKTWVDPIVGLTLRTPPDRFVQLRLYSEVGGFGVGSNFTWQAFPTVGLRLAPGFALELGYRWLDIDYESGEGADLFAYDMLTQGPVLGLAFMF